MSEAKDADLLVDIEVSEDQEKISLVVSSPNGEPVSKNDFILAVEMYLHEVTRAEERLADPDTRLH